MKKVPLITIVLGFITLFNQASAQRLFVNVMGGLANYTGDLQSKNFTLKQSHAAFAAGLSYELSEKFYLRGELSYAKVGADDKFSNKAFQKSRNLNFQTLIYEGNLLAEYDILNIYDHQLVPYVFAGIGVFNYNPYTYDSAGKKVYLRYQSTEGQGLKEYPTKTMYSRMQFNIPIGAGVKFALSDNLRVGIEMGFRKLFTDYLDDVSGRYPDLAILRAQKGSRAASLSFRGDELKPPVDFPGAGSVRGNPAVKDFYYFCMVRFSYRLPFHIFEGGGSRFKPANVDCPTVR